VRPLGHLEQTTSNMLLACQLPTARDCSSYTLCLERQGQQVPTRSLADALICCGSPNALSCAVALQERLLVQQLWAPPRLKMFPMSLITLLIHISFCDCRSGCWCSSWGRQASSTSSPATVTLSRSARARTLSGCVACRSTPVALVVSCAVLASRCVWTRNGAGRQQSGRLCRLAADNQLCRLSATGLVTPAFCTRVLAKRSGARPLSCPHWATLSVVRTSLSTILANRFCRCTRRTWCATCRRCCTGRYATAWCRPMRSRPSPPAARCALPFSTSLFPMSFIMLLRGADRRTGAPCLPRQGVLLSVILLYIVSPFCLVSFQSCFLSIMFLSSFLAETVLSSVCSTDQPLPCMCPTSLCLLRAAAVAQRGARRQRRGRRHLRGGPPQPRAHPGKRYRICCLRPRQVHLALETAKPNGFCCLQDECQ